MRIKAGGSRQKTIARPAQAILLETKHKQQRSARLLLTPVDLSMEDTLALLVRVWQNFLACLSATCHTHRFRV